jgi:two-component system, chemotaxis family, protein-glutamate methylesterase/glutaminase
MPKIRVLVVDDAVVIRKLVSEALGRDPDIEVVGVAANGRIALQKIPQVAPDILATLREVRQFFPKLPVIMFSTLTQKGAVATLEALSLGASDYVTKPTQVISLSEGIDRLEKELIPKIKSLCRTVLSPPTYQVRMDVAPRTETVASGTPNRSGPVQAICVGASTGGPNALAEVFTGLPPNLPVPLLIVQHMPPLFTTMLAARLTANSRTPCHEGEDGQPVQAGHAYLAPGGRHMEVERTGRGAILRLHDGPPENSCRPAVDVLFRNVAAAYDGAVLGVVMTGMGHDGLRGCSAIREHRGQVVVQDEGSSVVWGMPGSVAKAGLAHKILPLGELAAEIARRVRENRTGTTV